MYRLKAPPARAASATNSVFANAFVSVVGQGPGVGDTVAETPAPELGADAALVELAEDLHPAVKASSAMTSIKDSFRNIPFPPDWPLIRIIGS
jgi:hypothetical protein